MWYLIGLYGLLLIPVLCSNFRKSMVKNLWDPIFRVNMIVVGTANIEVNLVHQQSIYCSCCFHLEFIQSFAKTLTRSHFWAQLFKTNNIVS